MLKRGRSVWLKVAASGLLQTAYLLPLASRNDQLWLIRVGLERQAKGREIFVQSKGGAFRWIDVDTGRILAESFSEQLWRVVADGNGLLAEPVDAVPTPTPPKGKGIRIRGQRLRAEPVGDALLMVGVERTRLKPFRGAMEWQRLNPSPQRGEAILLTINWVRLDDYLKAVLPTEIPPRFHHEALKAQAVAARSFTFRRLNRHRGRGYDLCDTEHCQLYGGVQAEHPATNRAVEATVGEVLWHNGRVVEALYCGNCGGHTAPNEQVGVGTVALEPLRGVLDWDERAGRYYCDVAPNPRWSLTLSADELRRAFPEVGRPKVLRILERAISGHVARLVLEGDRAMLEITGVRFRQQLGATRLKSLLFTVEPDGDGWRLTGRGFGHGVGLCQWGAQGRALAGQDYRAILQAYYPGTMIAPLAGRSPSSNGAVSEKGEPRREGHRGSYEREGGAQDTSRTNR